MKKRAKDRNFCAAKIYALTLAAILSTGLLVRPLEAQNPIPNISAMAGPWECKDSNGIHGISVIASTELVDRPGVHQLTSQRVAIRVYQRQGGQERQGYLDSPDAKGNTVLDDNHLTIHFRNQIRNQTDTPSFDMDVRFDPAKLQWTGLWSLCDPTSGAVLERPRPGEAVPANILVGDWKGSQEPTLELVLNGAPEASGTLHIRQALDGELIGWVDLLENQLKSNSIQRNGEEVLFRSTDPNAVAFGLYDSAPMVRATYRYEGTLSADGKTLTGKWRINGGGVQSFPPVETQVPTVFRRIN